MPRKKPPPMVVLEPIFVRDHQRRLRLVIDLLEQEARRQPVSLANFDHNHNLKLGVPSPPRHPILEEDHENCRPVCSCFQRQTATP
jgi:hypothetical protein